MNPRDRLIFPLDVSSRQAALNWIELLYDQVGMFKVGLELFVAEGLSFLNTLADVLPDGYFLDLKFNDIPTTLKAAHHHLFKNVNFFTVYCNHDQQMLQETIDVLQNRVKFLAVTVLTSFSSDNLLTMGYDRHYALNPIKLVLLHARLAKAAGCSGVICSGQEVKMVKECFGSDFLVICPGIRPNWSRVAADDQKRVVTPYKAIQAGADYIVVGRPIRQANNPVEAAKLVVDEIEQAYH